MYHLNPETGQAGQCRARVRPCPYGPPGEHFASLQEARQAYEAYMSGAEPQPLSWLLSKKGEMLRKPEDQALFTRQCWEEAERFRANFPLREDGMWAHRELPYALRWYTMGGFAPINAVLRGQDRDYYDELIPEDRKALAREGIPVIDETFKLGPSGPRRVYRYTNLPGLSVDETLAQLEQTGEFHDPAYMSTSASMDFPLLKVLQKPEKGRVLLELAIDGPVIPLQEDEQVQQGDVQSHEHELLLPRGQRFRVVSVERRRACEVGELHRTYLTSAPWNLTKAERRLQGLTEARVPLVRMVQVTG